jgi:hypothetical protein
MGGPMIATSSNKASRGLAGRHPESKNTRALFLRLHAHIGMRESLASAAHSGQPHISETATLPARHVVLEGSEK